jgi:diguanylate cyclase (GGDEF)-like protein
LLIDVDLFKGINDAFGHTFGDTALTAVANAIDSATRGADLVVRYGGDEFAVVSPETGTTESAELIDRIITAVRELALVDHRGKRAMITVSIGAAVVSDAPGSSPRSADELLAAADQSLYRAKQTGRDRPGAPVVLSHA